MIKWFTHWWPGLLVLTCVLAYFATPYLLAKYHIPVWMAFLIMFMSGLIMLPMAMGGVIRIPLDKHIHESSVLDALIYAKDDHASEGK